MIQSCLTIRGHLSKSFTTAKLINIRHAHSGIIDPLQLKPLQQEGGLLDKLISAIRRRSAPAVWKAYTDLKDSGKIKEVPIQYHSMTLQSFRLNENGYYSSDKLKFYKKCVSDILVAAKKAQYKLDVRDYNVLLRLYGQSRDWKAASDCWNEIKVKKNEESYNLYMQAAVQCKKYDEVFKIFNKMNNDGIQPDVTTYNTLIEANGRMGNVTEADKLFRDYFAPKNTENKSTSIISKYFIKDANLSTYTPSAAPLSRCIPPLNAVLSPTTDTFEALIDAHGRKKNTPGLNYIHKTMLPQYDIKPDLKIYNALIRWYCHSGDIEAARNTFVDMEASGIKPNVAVFNHLFRHEALKRNRPKVAEAIIDYMRKEYGIRPSTSMYATLIRIHNKHNREDEANRLHTIYKALKSKKLEEQ
ncbi:hypothetical protein G6F43_008798 [Rhizopus delemar]|nr:hypothetical protein G6F43_008798 [Rhizopus delemar]